jgi:hypothetical protein
MAQPQAEWLDKWVSQSPIEKIYLHFDRSSYIAGQTAWFKAYLYSDFLPDSRSTTLFVELSRDTLSPIARLVFPVAGGFARGQLDIPDSLPAGVYNLRAYTATMLNHDPAFVYRKSLAIFRKSNEILTRPAADPNNVKIVFFPEGGNLVTGLSNSVAFRATGTDGLPVEVSGAVKNERGDKVAEFSSLHDGMGYFDLNVEEGREYYAEIPSMSPGQRYPLPGPTKNGVVLRIINNGATKLYEVMQRNDNPVFRAAYMIGHMQHHVVFRKSIGESEASLTGMIPVSKLPSGIMHITVFNKDGLPLAERLSFVDNHEYVQGGEVVTDTLDFSPHGKNHFTVSLKDTVVGSFSIAITDAEFENKARPDNILSSLLLTGDLKGYIHNPAYYFSGTGDSVASALDLVMMTNGWNRFKWEKLAKEGVPVNQFFDAGYIRLSGTINLKDSRRPFGGKDVMAVVVTPGAGKDFVMLKTDELGRFSTDSLLFFGQSRILFTDVKGKKSRFIDVKLTGDSLNRKFRMPVYRGDPASVANLLSPDQQQRMAQEYESYLKAEGLMLEGVTVKSRKKTPLEELEEKYVSPLFAGDANATIDLTSEDLTPYQNILDYLRLRVVGLQISKELDGPGYTVHYRQSPNVSMLAEIPMSIFLDEVPTDADVLAALPANQIALVKVFSSSVAASGNAPGGLLAVYTKKGPDAKGLNATGDIVPFNGYTVMREFFSPDYSDTKPAEKADNRVTLYWNPALAANGVNPRIPVSFYNNDRTRQFRIVVEGMTLDGKMLLIDKIVGSRKAF